MQLQNSLPLNEERDNALENQLAENRIQRNNNQNGENNEWHYPRRQNAGVNSRIIEDKYDTRGVVNLYGGYVDFFGFKMELVAQMPQTYHKTMNPDKVMV